MKLFKLSRLISIFLFLVFLFWLYLALPYLGHLFKYWSLSGSDISYTLKSRENLMSEELPIKPVSNEFSLIITKLGLNKRIVSGVDFHDENKLVSGLRQGLVHGKGSVFPGKRGATLILGHPINSFFNFGHYHPDFYLVSQLRPGDEVNLYYQGLNYPHRVTKTEIVSPTFLNFFDAGDERKLLLVSGYPPGLALKFFMVEAEPVVLEDSPLSN